MATLTISYDGRNRKARAVVDMLRALGLFEISEVKPKSRKEDPTLMSKEEYFAMIDQRRAEYEKGNYITFSSPEEMHRYFNQN